MKRVLFSFLFVLSSLTAVNAGETKTSTIQGKVVDLDGEAIIGAKIEIKALQLVSYTDFEGNFQFDKLPKDSYQIHFSSISFEQELLQMNFDVQQQNNEIVVELQSK